MPKIPKNIIPVINRKKLQSINVTQENKKAMMVEIINAFDDLLKVYDNLYTNSQLGSFVIDWPMHKTLKNIVGDDSIKPGDPYPILQDGNKLIFVDPQMRWADSVVKANDEVVLRVVFETGVIFC